MEGYQRLESPRLPVVCREEWPGEGLSDSVRSTAILSSESLLRTRSTISWIVFASSGLTSRTFPAPSGLGAARYPYGTLPPV